MRPKLLLWIAFSVASITWYGLDPAAHPRGDAVAKVPSTEVRQLAHEGTPVTGSMVDRQGLLRLL